MGEVGNPVALQRWM